MEVRLEQLASNVHHRLGLALKKEQTVTCHQFYLKGKTWKDPPGGGHGNPLQYSCLENPMDRGAWCATVHGLAQS